MTNEPLTAKEAQLILQLIAGARADPNTPDYIDTCITIKSINDKCVAAAKQEPPAVATASAK